MYKVVGVMSGTSLDGLDLCLCNFDRTNGKWQYEFIKSATIPYSNKWLKKLVEAPKLSSQDLLLLDIEYGEYIGNSIMGFLDNKYSIDLISSHGHTVFHQPQKKLTLQIGNGLAIASITGIETVSDFRKLDVLLNGQGAPLVPVGDQLLFNDYDACVNLGGFSNISFEDIGKRIAFDICPVNIVLNYLSNKLDLEYDHNGAIARSGNIEPKLLEKLEKLEFYKQKPPKSLGREWVEKCILPLFVNSSLEVRDIMRTFVEHISLQIANIIHHHQLNKILFTGGGSKNDFIIQCIKKKVGSEIIIPNEELIDYKEALIFGLLGILNKRREINTLKSVTGAIEDTCGGILHYPF